jgi:perosamine synthetase
MFKETIGFIKKLYPNKEFIPLHAPVFNGNEKKYVNDCIDSTFVSSVGEYVNKFEKMICDYTGAKFAIATTNGTSALHMSLILAGVERDTEVITQALTFVATTNAIAYLGAYPAFIDSEKDNMGMCPQGLSEFFNKYVEMREGSAFNKQTGRKIKACVPMHVFGNPVDTDALVIICDKYNVTLIEDAAESLGSYYKGAHTGIRGSMGTLSFNGNKIVTCGGGGMIVTNDESLAKKAKHLTTTAKRPHAWEFFHDEVGYNYRLPNLNAAMACAQMESLPMFVENKRETAKQYREFFANTDIRFFDESSDCKSNFWLNAIQLKNRTERDEFLNLTNKNGVMTRPLWVLMNELPAFANCFSMPLTHAKKYADTIVNIPSSVRTE